MMLSKLKVSILVTFLITSLFATLIPMFSITYGQIDSSPPQLIIYDKDFNTCKSEITVQGSSYDESGVKNVTVNGQTVDAYSKSDVHYFWQKKVCLHEGTNTIAIKAYDESSNNNEVMEIFTITYQPTAYNGPSVQIMSVTNQQPSNNATVQCIVNPHGVDTYVYLWASYSTFGNAPYNWGRGLETYSGTEEVIVTYTFDQPNGLSVGSDVSYIFRVRNNKGTEFTEVATFMVTESIHLPDTEPPQITPPNGRNYFTTPNSIFPLNVEVSDASGIKNVTINGEPVTGTYIDDYFFGFKNLQLETGINEVTVLAYDNSPNHLMSEKVVTIDYQPSMYSGPTISLVIPTNITENSASFNCIVNPHGYCTRVYLYYSDTYRNHAPFNQGRSLYYYEGYEDISVQYLFESDQPEREISYLFIASSGNKYAYAEMMTVTIKKGVVTFSATPESPYALLPMTFDASISFSPFGAIDSYSWDFGDGSTTTSESPTISHTFENQGNFEVNLSILDSYGLTKSTISNIVVLMDNEAPITSTNYDELWHDSEFTINLVVDDSESGVAETYYKLNSADEKSLSIDGNPQITAEGEDNVLEFWSVDNVGNVENVQTLSSIKLDTTKPIIGIPITIPKTGMQADRDVKVTIDVSDSLSGVDLVTLEYSVDAGITSNTSLMVLNSTSGLWGTTIPGQPIWTNVTYKITAQDIAGNTASTGMDANLNYEVIPEFPSNIILVLFLTVALCAFVLNTKLRKQ